MTEHDIGAELYEKVKAEFDKSISENKSIINFIKKIDNNTATMLDMSRYTMSLGDTLAEVLKKHITQDVLPDGKMYYNIADKVLTPMMEQNHTLVNYRACEVQRVVNKAKGIGIEPQKTKFPKERVNQIVNGVAHAKDWETTARRLDSPVRNAVNSYLDDFVETNADFEHKAGLTVYIIRQEHGKCCKWCASLAGKYHYPDEVPADVYRRHDNCTCTTTFVSKKGLQDVWTKKSWEAGNEIAFEEYKPNVLDKNDVKKFKPTVLSKEQANKAELNALNSVDKSNVSDIIKNISLDDIKSAISGGEIQDEVAKTIFDTLNESNSQYLFNAVVVKKIDPKIVMQTDPVRKGTFFDTKLNLNENFLGGKTVEQLDKEIRNSKKTVANSLKEATIHEKYHAKLINGLNQAQLESLYDVLSEYHIDGISPTAYIDGSECIAEIGVLLERGETKNIPKEAVELFNKYMGELL